MSISGALAPAEALQAPPTAAERRTEELLAVAREGDDRAFEELLRLHREPVYRLALAMLGDRETAADVCQDVFIRFFRALRRLSAKRGIRAWLRRVTIHRCYDVLRARRRNRDIEAEFLPNCMQPDDGFDIEQFSAWLARALDSLSPRQRAAFALTCHQGYSSEEAALTMGCRPATVRVLVLKAREKLRAAFFGNNGRRR